MDQRIVALAEFGPGQQRVFGIAGVLVPEPGPWRITALADAAGTLAEPNRGNNERVLDVASVPGLCLP